MTKQSMANDPKAKGGRLQQLRNLARFTQNDIANLANVSLSGYKGWEMGRHGGLPEKRAIFLVPIFQAEGINCNFEWLMYGVGNPPIKNQGYCPTDNKVSHQIFEKFAKTEKEHIQDELNFFRNNYLNSLDLIIPDDAMAPQFLPNDIIAGIKLSNKNFHRAIGLNCIIQTMAGDILLRQLQKGIKKDRYTLLCTNLTSLQETILHEVELINVAPVLWHRKEKLTF